MCLRLLFLLCPSQSIFFSHHYPYIRAGWVSCMFLPGKRGLMVSNGNLYGIARSSIACSFCDVCRWQSCFCCVLVLFFQSKSVSSTDSQPTEERQGPSGGYSSMQGGAEAKRRRCDDKESLPSHSYVCVSVSLCIFMSVDLHLEFLMDDSDSYTLTHPYTYSFLLLECQKFMSKCIKL